MALTLTENPEVEEKAKFLLMFDRFFDCMNVGNFIAGVRSLKNFKQPYRSSNDFRLKVQVTHKLNLMYYYDISSGCNTTSLTIWINGKRVCMPFQD